MFREPSEETFEIVKSIKAQWPAGF